MRSTALLAVLVGFLAGCGVTPDSPATPDPVSVTFATTTINSLTLELREENGRCVLAYIPGKQHGPVGAAGNKVPLDMNAPCNFVRRQQKPDEILTYSPLKNDAFNRKVLLIVGGEPDADLPSPLTDQFMPKGCGTWMQKVTVFDTFVNIQFPAAKGSTHCPSYGADEVFFAA